MVVKELKNIENNELIGYLIDGVKAVGVDNEEVQKYIEDGGIVEEADTPPEPTYQELRKAEYPPMEDFADAWVKDDVVAMEQYKQDCLLVKAKYPKV